MDSRFASDIDLGALCNAIRELIPEQRYEECEYLLNAAMRQHPHAPHPHNLYGLLFEAKGDHRTAMNHFRAAWALDDTYKPAHHNLNHFGTFHPRGKWAFDESDCPEEEDAETHAIEHGSDGIRRVVKSRPCRVRYDANGVGHIVRMEE